MFTPTVPVVVLTEDLYQGTRYSSPLPWPAGATTVIANGLLSDQDGKDAAKTSGFAVEVSFNGGKDYQFAAGATWTGGLARDGVSAALPNVQVSYGASGQVPSHARIRYELPAVLSIGGTLSFA
jgi:hypothetical protein